MDSINLYGWAKSESPPYDESKFDKNVILEGIVNTLDDSHIVYFVRVDLKYPHKIIEKAKYFLFIREIKTKPQDKISEQMNDLKPNIYTQKSSYVIELMKRII